ncbi:hypothetical protein DDB_G0289729 [Dictyostelium discoideum AX4]|uniref:DUF962 domain-containing protein n=1 Tax=Dictyostelium discoideum TaxID=44689 RepID=Q54H35_DICDI|nr:hypothetical protein DDB_G0289729 [Dictyostelium discoideum AX4]EAL62576.1 hypothetical protein DDB_G0289729 [Dictyostelium discoideum AX4]|eukprot:XP_636083.1 hypothetical protein DDB_G0289729 [Dictyostelium discoideum AX4]
MTGHKLFNLKEAYSLYAVHHSNHINKIIHILFVPCSMFIIKKFINLSTIFALLLCAYVCYLDCKIGLITSAWILMTNYLANSKIEDIGLTRATTDGVKLLAIALVVLLLGHLIFEGVSHTFSLPAEPLAVFVVPLFVTYEVLFYFGLCKDTQILIYSKINSYL